ncbi:hypothetical protein SBOR_9188 [Sclerotinia borealis F-4128]|uniref:Rhodopsin domain-containing protein n=1 Tax=Sclerotinia borealis (strain F-4128) TaxID=1432307 RepID=W9C402_SCLBF|nr:hypothetical protein SBOR_9188 [Sclerotinia borealis F-4128]
MNGIIFVVESWTCWAIAVIFIALRIFGRVSKLGWKQLKLDDGLMFCALFAYTAEATSSHYLSARWLGYSNSGMTETERETLDPNSIEWSYRVNGAKTHIWDWITYISLMWLLKACWIAYYARLIAAAAEKRSLRRITIGYVVLGVTYLSAILVVFCKCMPLKKQWQIYPDPGNLCYPGNSTFQMAFVMSLNTLTHMYILVIPLPSILATKGMLPYQKVFILVLYSGGFLVTAFGILRCISILTDLGTTTSVGQWSLWESFLAVLVTNLPIIGPLIKSSSHQLRSHSTKISSYDGTSPFNRSTDVELNDINSPQHPSKSRGKKPSLISRTKEIGDWDDDEQIMVPKPTLGRNYTNAKIAAPSHHHDDVGGEDTHQHHPIRTHSQNDSKEDGLIAALSGLDLVPKKEKNNMITTVQAGYGNHRRWNWSREEREREREEGEEALEVQEGGIRVVREFRYTNSAGATYGGPVAGR